MSIQEHLNKIRNAIYGREVRESIAKGIETAYDDASEKDNANMEVKIARGTNPNLNTRLNKMDETDRQVTAQLAQKANETDVRESTDTLPIDVDEMNTRTKQLFTGGSVAVVGENAVGRENIKRKAVSPSETDFIDVEIVSVNLFNKNASGILQGKFISAEGTFNDNEDYLISDFIEVKPNTEYRVVGALGTPNFSNVYDGGYQLINVSPRDATNTPHNARFIRIHMLKTQVDKVMLYEYKGVALSVLDFVPYKESYTLKDDIEIGDGQVTPEKLFHKELSPEYRELDSYVGNNYLTDVGVMREVGKTELTGTKLSRLNRGTHVDALEFDKKHFQNTAPWPSTDEKITMITGEFDKGEIPIQSIWDNVNNIGYHMKSFVTLYIFVEKDRFSTIQEAVDYLNANPIEVYYTLAQFDFLPYPSNLSENTREIINLKRSLSSAFGVEGEEWSEI